MTAPTGASHDHERVLRILHQTTYRYQDVVEHSRHKLRLRPVHDRYQALLEHTVYTAPTSATTELEDVFGNHVMRFELCQHYRELVVRSESIVRVDPVPALQAPSDRTTIPLIWMPWQRQMMWPYLMPPELPESELHALSDYAMTFVQRHDSDILGTLFDINATIKREFEYLPGSTTLETTAFEVLTVRRGVCQDFANLFICLARLLGLPARYRVGYILNGAATPSNQSDASHAWAEVYLPWSGWRGFDPTNGTLAGTDHIRVACGRNYRDATPTAGTIFQGGGPERLVVDVRVTDETAPGAALPEPRTVP